MVWKDGRKYDGDFVNGNRCAHTHPAPACPCPRRGARARPPPPPSRSRMGGQALASEPLIPISAPPPLSREGVGKMELANGDRYVGEWRNDQMHGKGRYISEDGEYDGYWAAGLREGQVLPRGAHIRPSTRLVERPPVLAHARASGFAQSHRVVTVLLSCSSPVQGTLTLKAGTVYTGGFSRHQYHGRGLLKLQNGTYYDGEFVRGQMQGQGFRTYPDGSIYEGTFHQGTCHGKGRWFSTTRNGWLFDGLFTYGRPVDGEMTLSDGQVWHHVYPASGTDIKGFDGQQLDPTVRRRVGKFGQGWDGQRDFTGNMIWTWDDGREFRGQFENGAPVRGRLFDLDQSWYDVQYNEGIRISDESLVPSFKKLAPEEVEKDLRFSQNLEEIHKRLESEEQAYEQMLQAIEQELEARVLAETKLWVPPSPPTPPEVDRGEFEVASSAKNISITFKLNLSFNVTGTADSPDRAAFMAEFIQDLVNATGTHERLFRITKLAEGSVIISVEIIPDSYGEFKERTPAEIALFLHEQSKKPLSKFMRGKWTKKLVDFDLPESVFQVLKEEEIARRPKTVVQQVVKEEPPPPPARWSPALENLSWHPDVLGVGFHIGRVDLRAAAQYKSQLKAIHEYNMEQLAKQPKPPPRVPTPEPDYLSGTELVQQIREFVAFLYAGSTMVDKTISDDERYATHPTSAATGMHPKTAQSSRTNKSSHSNQGVVRERRDQRRAAKGLLELLGGNPEGCFDSKDGWYVEPFFNKKLAQATSTSELLWAHGGIKALVYVLRGAYPDHEFTEDLSKARNEKEREEIVKSSVVKGNVDIRELASECVARACALNPANRMRLRMKIAANRPEGDGVLALVELLSRGPDGSRERAAAALAVVCKGDLQNKQDVALEGGIEALLELFAEHSPAALKLVEVNRLYDMAESRKFRASAAANQQMRVTLMEEAQKEMDVLGDLRRVLQHRMVKNKEAAIEALYTVTTDCHSACENMLLDGGLKVMKETIKERMQTDHTSREGIVEIESATGIIENVCRSFFQPGVLKEPSSIPQNSIGSSSVAAAVRDMQEQIISSDQLQTLRNEVDKNDLLGLLLGLLRPEIDLRIQARAAAALWAIVDSDNSRYTAQILASGSLPIIMKILYYGEQDEMEAREQFVGLLSSMLKGNEECAVAAKSLGAVARLMHLMNLGDDGLGAFSTQELAASGLVEMLETSEDCRTEARRSGIRTMIKALTESPLLNSPNDLERHQAQSSKATAQKLLRLVNLPPRRGERG